MPAKKTLKFGDPKKVWNFSEWRNAPKLHEKGGEILFKVST